MKKYLLLISIIIFIIFIFLSDPIKLFYAFEKFNFTFLIPIFLLSILGYLIRFFRWEFLLKKSNISLNKKESFLIFLSGFLMTVTPVKAGEAIKSIYLKKIGIRYRKSIPVVGAERVYDIIGMIILIILSSFFITTSTYQVFFAIAIIVLFLFLGIFYSDKIINTILFFFKKIGLRTKKISGKNISKDIKKLFEKKTFVILSATGALAWFAECIGFFLVLNGFGIKPLVARETFIFCASSIAGAVSMLPGGIGITEGGMAGLLTQLAGLSLSVAAAATLIIRATTLWFAVLVGWIANILLGIFYEH